MPKTPEDTTTVEHPTEQATRVPTGEAVPKIWQIVFIAVIIAGFTIAWLTIWAFLTWPSRRMTSSQPTTG